MRASPGLAASLGLWLGVLPLACAGGYPLPPTPCDEWCDATNGMLCGDSYDPAGCVSSCEAALPAGGQCLSELGAETACYRANPQARAQNCAIFAAQPCDAQRNALAACEAAYARPPRY